MNYKDEESEQKIFKSKSLPAVGFELLNLGVLVCRLIH